MSAPKPTPPPPPSCDPRRPTRALPGSGQKVDVLVARRHAHQPLFVEGDTTSDLSRGLAVLSGRNGAVEITGTVDEHAEPEDAMAILGVPAARFPLILRLLRKRAGLSTAGLGERAHLSSRAVRAYEAATREPSLSSLLALARALETSVSWLVGEQMMAKAG